jgi:L-serine dehydratase
MISVFDLFKIGIGPSSSHTVGPMRAAALFLEALTAAGQFGDVNRVVCTLYGSLAWTGEGHATDKALVLGLSGERPDTIVPYRIEPLFTEVQTTRRLQLGGTRPIDFNLATEIVFDRKTPAPRHPNTLELTAFGQGDAPLLTERYCSIGGGFVVVERQFGEANAAPAAAVPFDYQTGAELLAIGRRNGLSIAEIVLANEQALRPVAEVRTGLDRLRLTMLECIDRGMKTEGQLPGPLKVRRRAKGLRERLDADRFRNDVKPHSIMDWVSMYAIAVNEENAAGGRVVTAPTNGAAGIIPAVLKYYRDHCRGAGTRGEDDYMLVAAGIGALIKKNASISGAEVGCQGEVGSAASMAAGGLAAALGATNEQIENAAEIAMEHHLGMTCDPIGGLVQIPCIERNAFGAVKAIAAASLAMRGDGTHVVSLDQVIKTMRDTGEDMHSKYKETSQGGLAVNVIEC